MAPRRSQGKSIPEPREASGSLTPPPTPPLDPVPISGTISKESWARGGSDAVRDRLLQQLQGDDSEPEIRLAEIWVEVLTSDLDVDDIAALYRACKEQLDEAKRGVLAEGLVEVVEALEEVREDLSGDSKAPVGGKGIGQFAGKLGGEAIVVDDEDQSLGAGPKGMQVVKALLESSDLAGHIPTLLLQPERLVPLDLHPIQQNPASLQRNLIKKATTLFYKQSKYNLLRESSEGFSNLIVLLTSSDSLSSSPLDESGPNRRERAKRVWSKIMGLIGYFNLSPPRVLDLILEVASNHVAAHWRFWLDLLRCSPWGSHADGGDVKGKGRELAVDWQTDEAAAIEQCMQGKGDRVLAQVLGVKFGFCQRPDGGDTPSGLVYITALLLKHGFVSLPDVLPFLSPDDTEMAAIRQKHLSASSSRSGPLNALANSVLLDDDAPAADAPAADAGPSSKPAPEQRIQLLQALLAVGHMPAALYFLGRFPWLAQYSPTVADLILRIVEIGVEGVYAEWAETSDLGPQAPAATYRVPIKEVVPTLLAPLPPDTPTSTFVFFYPDWSEGMERWTNIEDIRGKGMRWLSLVRGLGGRRVEVMVKICRIGAKYFERLHKEKEAALGLGGGGKTRKQARDLLPTEAEMQQWIELLRVSILPSLSGSMTTAPFNYEVWPILRYFPYTVRYGLYGEWRNITCQLGNRFTCPIAAQAAAENTREVKKALSRVTAAQTGPGAAAGTPDRGPARALAKLSHSNPCSLWATAVMQVKSYSNIGQHIVEAGRYMSPLAMDVATFTLVDTLSDDTATRLNPQGTGVASWLENLATFVGDFNRRYSTVDLEPVLQFIINRLMRGQSADLTILQSLISIMSGESKIDNDAISNDQLKAYGAGREMIRESFNATVLSVSKPHAPGDPAGQGAQAAPTDKAKPTKKSLARLISGLRDTGLDMPIWIALAQTRQGAVDKMVGAPIKAMSSMQDNYGDLLSEQLASTEHIERTPDLDSLVSEFGLDFAQAFQILRPKLNAEMDKVRSAEKAAMAVKLESAKQTLSTNGSPQPTTPVLSSPRIEGMQIDGEEGSEYGSEAGTPSAATIPLPQTKNVRRRWWPSALTATMRQAQGLLPAEVKEVMSAPFFVIFWHLSMPDISFADETYQKSIDRLTAMEKDITSWRGGNSDFQKQQRDERARLKLRIEALTEEREVQSILVNTINKRRLRLESSKWFGSSITQNNLKTKLSHQLHQYCFYPRALLTPSDAVFVPKLIRLMHDLGTSGFVTLFAYSNFFTPHLAGSIFSCTENEARNLGRCLAAIMTDLDSWHNDEDRYNREAIGLPEGITGDEEAKGLPGMQIQGKNQGSDKPMPWTTFRNFYVAKFHVPMLEALVSCWAETDFMHVKNAITVALQVLKSFPMLTTHGDTVEKAMKALIKRGKDGELTPDVLHQCQAYARQLKLRQNHTPYISPPKFYPNGKTVTPAEPAKNAPTGPRSTTEPSERRGSAPLTPTGSAAQQLPSAPDTPKMEAPAAPAVMADPKALRARLEESKALRSASAAAKEEPKNAASPRRELAGDKAAVPSKPAATADKAPSLSVKGAAAKSEDQKPARPLPTGPAKPNGIAGLPLRPGSAVPAPVPSSTTAKSMGPPPNVTADEEKAAARAKKFGTLSRDNTPSSRPGTPSADVPAAPPAPTAPAAEVKAEPTRPASPAGSRKASPPARSRHRSRSIESRASERSRRDRKDDRDEREPRSGRDKDRDRRDRDKGREDDRYVPSSSRDRDRTPSTRKDEEVPSSRDRTPSGRGKDDEERDKKKQEDILKDRAERLDLGGGEKERSSRRESKDGRRDDKDRERDERKGRDRDGREGRDGRDRERRSGRESDREREKEKEKEEKREKEKEREREKEREDKEREREKEKRAADEHSSSKRKREAEEPPRRIDPITSTRRSDEPHRDSRRKDEHRERERDRGYAHRDERRERDERDDRRDRDERDDRYRDSGHKDRRSRAGGVDRDDREPPPHASIRGSSSQREQPPHIATAAAAPGGNLMPQRSPTSVKRYSPPLPIDEIQTPNLTPKRDSSPKRSRVELLSGEMEKRAGRIELLPPGPAVDPERITESPRPREISTPVGRSRPSRFSDDRAQIPSAPSPTTSTSGASLPSKGPHGLPARPDAAVTAVPVNPRAGGNGNGPAGGLMARMGPARPDSPASRHRSANPSPERQERRDEPPSKGRGEPRRDEPDRPRREDQDRRRRDERDDRDERERSERGDRGDRERSERGDRDRGDRGERGERGERGDRGDRGDRGERGERGEREERGEESRKRALEDPAPPAARDGSPGTAPKRVKIDRNKVARNQANKIFDSAMRATTGR